MREENNGAVLNDLSNLFIWSGFKYYLTKQTDSYILYSPTKYWRNQNLVNKRFMDGFFCNRKEFHASQVSAIGCIWWKNIDDSFTECLTLTPYDAIGNIVQRATDDIIIKKGYHKFSEAYDLRSFDDDTKDGILCETNGSEYIHDDRQKRATPVYNKNIIAYMMVHSFLIDRKNVSLARTAIFKGDGFFVRSDNFLEKLPLFVAATFPYDKWYKTDVYSKTYDGQGIHLADKEFLKRCLFYTALTPKNKCRSFMGSDKRFYRNELCFDCNDTLACIELQNFINQGFMLTDAEQTLLKYWNDVVFEAVKTDEYKAAKKSNEKIRYGLWQIMEELNIQIDNGRKDRKGNPVYVYKYNTLNTEIKKLDNALKKYYETDIIPALFKYELIK
jgi:hypothetical protein